MRLTRVEPLDSRFWAKEGAGLVDALTRAAVLATSCLLASCVMFPIGGGEPHPFGKKRLAFIEMGVTRKEDVRHELGEPGARYGEKWWVHRAARRGSDWLVIMGGGYMGDSTTLEGDTSYYRLLIGFKADGTVWRYGVIGDDAPCDSHRGLCYQNSKVFVSVEPEAMPIDDPNCDVEYKLGEEVLRGCVYDLSEAGAPSLKE